MSICFVRRPVAPLVVGAVFCVSACHRVATGTVPSMDVDARRAELVQVDRFAEARARTGGFVAAFADLFAREGVYLHPGPITLRGPAGAREWLERDTLNARSTARWTVLRADVSADGRDGYTYGYFDVVRPAGDTLLGKYQAYWRRAEGGRWEILAFSRGRRAPGAPTAALPSSVSRAAPPSRAFPMRDSVAAFREVANTERAFCDSAGVDVGAAFAGFAAPDVGKNEGGSEYVFGPAAVGRIFAGAPRGAGPLWRPEAGTVASSNDLAFTFGPAWPRQSGAADPPPTAGRYFTIWRRQPDGTWRYVVD